MTQDLPVSARTSEPESKKQDAADAVLNPDDVHALNDSFSYDFEQLAGGAKCIVIRLGETMYTLRKTRTGKLVLNK
ncbi:MAG: hemin uptake protein HemP [Planctomycetota bacterium]|nr:hemin uptake protein HemP [Planctomycetota bacterium]